MVCLFYFEWTFYFLRVNCSLLGKMRFEVVNSKHTKKGLEKCLERLGKLYSEGDKSIANTPTCSLYMSTGKCLCTLGIPINSTFK